ncbi:MAG: hypothetical protein QM820_21330 [Minicystis sp.]
MTNTYESTFESTNADSYETSDTDKKYAKIEVPGWTLETTISLSSASGSSATKGYGDSFLRLGSFPATAGDEPSGYAASYTLAKLVGDTSRFSNQKGASFTDTKTVDDSETSTDPLGIIDSVIASNPYMGDKSYLVGFADDTRSRDSSAETISIDGVSVTNTVDARKGETKRLLTKGGTWDHADGNRITTTCGDKIEIVQGNYKLVVLGRQNPTSTSLSSTGSPAETPRIYVSDISGGRDSTKVGGYDPGDFDKYDFVKIYEWLPKQKAWASYEYNNPKRTYSWSGGISVSVFTGTKKVTQTGRAGGGEDENPHVVSKTWAERTESYTGSPKNWVEHAFSMNNTGFKYDYSNTTHNYSVKPGASIAAAVSRINADVKYGTITVTAYVGIEQFKLTTQPIYYDIKWGILKTEFNLQKEFKLAAYESSMKVETAACQAVSTFMVQTAVNFVDDELEVGGPSANLATLQVSVPQFKFRQSGISHV